MNRKFIYGQPVEQKGQCVVPDNTVTHFTVSIRHMGNLSADMVKNLLQQRFEVLNIQKTQEVTVVREHRLNGGYIDN